MSLNIFFLLIYIKIITLSLIITYWKISRTSCDNFSFVARIIHVKILEADLPLDELEYLLANWKHEKIKQNKNMFENKSISIIP